MKLLKKSSVILFYLALALPINLFAEELIGLPRTEGSKSFDMEINQLNNIGIKHYSSNELDRANESLKKAIRSRCLGSILAWILKTKPVTFSSSG